MDAGMVHTGEAEPTIALTPFAIERHFDPDVAGTVITSQSPEQFEQAVRLRVDRSHLRPGYADFCKIAFIENWTDARAGILPITPENKRFLKSGYRARTAEEMPILVRWFEGIEAPRAEWLGIILYSAEQLAKEDRVAALSITGVKPSMSVDADFGIVAILGQTKDREEPMSPATIWRNALGIGVGGSGVAIDPKGYAISVGFWDTHAAVGHKSEDKL